MTEDKRVTALVHLLLFLLVLLDTHTFRGLAPLFMLDSSLLGPGHHNHALPPPASGQTLSIGKNKFLAVSRFCAERQRPESPKEQGEESQRPTLHSG